MKRTSYGLAVLLGKQPENFLLTDGDLPIATEKIPSDLPSTLLLRRPDIRQAEAKLH